MTDTPTVESEYDVAVEGRNASSPNTEVIHLPCSGNAKSIYDAAQVLSKAAEAVISYTNKDEPTKRVHLECGHYAHQEKLPKAVLEIYSQTQNWARHNENLIMASNAMILGAIGAISVAVLKDWEKFGPLIYVFFGLIILIAIAGIKFNSILKKRYNDSIIRLLTYERLFGFHDHDSSLQRYLNSSDNCPYPEIRDHWQSNSSNVSLVPFYLHDPQKVTPDSVKFFQAAYLSVFVIVAIAFLVFNHSQPRIISEVSKQEVNERIKPKPVASIIAGARESNVVLKPYGATQPISK